MKILGKVLSFVLLLIVFSLDSYAASNAVSCDSNQAFGSNSCDTCLDGGTAVEDDTIGFFADNWYNDSDEQQILYKEEQVMPWLIPLWGTSWVESKANPQANFWEYTPEFESLYIESDEGYVLEAGKTVRWIESSLGSGYKLLSNPAEEDLPVGMIVYDRGVHEIFSDGNINIITDTHRECVLIRSGASSPAAQEVNTEINTPIIESSFTVSDLNNNAANFLAEMWIIETNFDYKLDSTITRREMLKVMMNLYWERESNEISWWEENMLNYCSGKFEDMLPSDWGCKYAEAALGEWFIAGNKDFRPDDSVSQIEALKMIMQARNIPKQYQTKWVETEEQRNEVEENWKAAYVLGANYRDTFLLGNWWDIDDVDLWSHDFEYDIPANRWFVFLTSARTSSDFLMNPNYWRWFTHSSDWNVKYPENWVYRDDGETVQFWPKWHNGLDAFYIRSTDDSYESLQVHIKLWDYWSIQSQTVEDIKTLGWLSGKLYVTVGLTRNEQEHIFKKVIIKWENSNYILSGDERYIEWFYKSFQE